MALSLSDFTLNKYFRFLVGLDVNSKKKLINQLTQSIETHKSPDWRQFSGSWESNLSSDEIILQLKSARLERDQDIDFK